MHERYLASGAFSNVAITVRGFNLYRVNASSAPNCHTKQLDMVVLLFRMRCRVANLSTFLPPLRMTRAISKNF